MMHIRLATSLDSDDIRELYLSAFSNDERQQVAMLAINLLNEKSNPETLSLVAEVDGEVVGHIAFSPVTVEDNNTWSGYILAPLAVKPEFQKRLIGSTLIKDGIQRLSTMDVDIVFVYGDPDYYGKFGFNPDHASSYCPPYTLEYPFGWQAMIFNEDIDTKAAKNISCVAALNDPALW